MEEIQSALRKVWKQDNVQTQEAKIRIKYPPARKYSGFQFLHALH